MADQGQPAHPPHLAGPPLGPAGGRPLPHAGPANWLFFRKQSPAAGLLATLALDVSNVQLIGRVVRADKTAAVALLPYAAWCVFATALNAELAERNCSRRGGREKGPAPP
ncbi:TspO/MBR family protein [Streptomyces sp. NPDC006208]|uniref:TspO/MBR family protein n=1 Tax=Streptomyces sp. NPDC006208 TaxID=3156734 RepID=UPI0033B87745